MKLSFLFLSSFYLFFSSLPLSLWLTCVVGWTFLRLFVVFSTTSPELWPIAFVVKRDFRGEEDCKRQSLIRLQDFPSVAFGGSGGIVPLAEPNTQSGRHAPTPSDGRPPPANDLVGDTGGQDPPAMGASVDLTNVEPPFPVFSAFVATNHSNSCRVPVSPSRQYS